MTAFKNPGAYLSRFQFFHPFKKFVSHINKEFGLKDNSVFCVDENITFDEYGNPLYLETPSLKK